MHYQQSSQSSHKLYHKKDAVSEFSLAGIDELRWEYVKSTISCLLVVIAKYNLFQLF